MAYKKTYNPCDECQYSFTKNNQESGMCKICEFKQLLDNTTADVVEVRHGHWIHKVKRYPYQPDDCEAVCSVCGMDYALDPEYTIKYFAMHNKFCPNCGARMDGDAE